MSVEKSVEFRSHVLSSAPRITSPAGGAFYALFAYFARPDIPEELLVV